MCENVCKTEYKKGFLCYNMNLLAKHVIAFSRTLTRKVCFMLLLSIYLSIYYNFIS